MLGNGYVNAPIAGVELLPPVHLRSLGAAQEPKLPEQKAVSALLCSALSTMPSTLLGQLLLLLWQSQRALSSCRALSSVLAKAEIICKCAKFWHNARKPVNHTHTQRRGQSATYHSNLKGKSCDSSSSAQSIFTKNVARSLGMQRMRELELSLNVMRGDLCASCSCLEASVKKTRNAYKKKESTRKYAIQFKTPERVIFLLFLVHSWGNQLIIIWNIYKYSLRISSPIYLLMSLCTERNKYLNELASLKGLATIICS